MLRTQAHYRIPGFHGQAPFDISQLLEQVLGAGAKNACESNACAWAPRVDLKQTDEAFFITVDLPGVATDAINLQVDKGVLTIEGSRAEAELAEGETRVRQERHHGNFKRNFNLPDNANVEDITASSKHGVLEVRIGKQAQAQPRRIDITA